MGVAFEVRVPDVEELTEGPPAEVVLENAHRKAAAIAAQLSEAEAAQRCVLGVDTEVVLGARIFGKPRDEDHARETLAALAGRRHVVLSGLCLIEPAPAPGEPARTRT
ncbi:MAG: Maf family protein, partial [Solirubrobacteraceae bacterium]